MNWEFGNVLGNGVMNVAVGFCGALEHCFMTLKMLKQVYLRGDVNGNGVIDNDNEARRNTEFNSVDIANLQRELKGLKRRVDISAFVANNLARDKTNFAATSKMAEELNDGRNRCYFNNIGRSVAFKYGNKPMTQCVQIGTDKGYIKNVESLSLVDCEPIKAFVQSRGELTEAQAKQSVPSVKVVNDVVTAINTALNGKSNTGHTHDDKYLKLSDVVDDFSGVTIDKVPNVDAVKGYCADFLTAEKITNDVNLMEHLRGGDGRSAFDVWKEQQPPKVPDYTVSDFIDAITANAVNGASAFEVWKEQQPPKNPDYTYADYLAAITGPSGANAFEVWKAQQPPKNPDYTFSEYLAAITGPSGAKGDKGDTGENGLSAFEVWKAQQTPKQEGEDDYTFADYLAAIKGATGANGEKGENGLSAFEVWKEQQPPRDPDYTFQDYFNALSAEGALRGLSAFDIWKELQPPRDPDYTYRDFIAGITGPRGPAGANGAAGPRGLSTFEIWCVYKGYDPAEKSYEDFLNDLHGAPGADGHNGQDGEDAGGSWLTAVINGVLQAGNISATAANVVAVQGQLEALQAQIAVIEGQLMTMMGSDTAEAFADAIDDAADASLTLGQRASNVFQSVANVFRNLGQNLQVARNGATSAASSIRAGFAGYVRI